jgi:hypothetical protein
LHYAVAKLEEAVLDALDNLTRDADAPDVDALALQLLLRRYQSGASSDRNDDETIGRALANALDHQVADASVAGRAAWVELFVEASALSNDERLVPAVGALTAGLRTSWATGPLADQCTAIAGCLHAAALPAFRSGAADAVDELERIVGRAYEPGEHIGSFADQVRAASALLVAYALSGRLPYPMLAEELMQARRIDETADFVTACEAARVLCRLAALHDDAGYRAAALIAPGADYRRDAGLLMDARTDEALRKGAGGAIYALARLELESP